MYESLIKYLPLLSSDGIGDWVIDKENDGTSEHPIQMPYVNYSKWCISLLTIFIHLLISIQK